MPAVSSETNATSVGELLERTPLSSVATGTAINHDHYRVEWLRCWPFFAMHAACLGVFWVGWSPIAVAIAGGLYALRAFALTGFYHRYFSHRTFKTSRWCQFLFAMIGNASVQRGPLWWAAHHRQHHAHSDENDDAHSPVQHGFLWSHMLWFTNRHNYATRYELVPDWARFPELRALDKHDKVVPVLLAVSLYGLGRWLQLRYPSLGTSGPQLLVWGFLISTIALFHATGAINSLAHRLGARRYETPDESRNNWLLALLTLGEGWHNNHHHYPNSVRQGFFWWEIDVTYYLLRAMSWFGLVWELKPVPARMLRTGLAKARE
jgi:stearoyl-CoA desaturase (delta-9 desaturase)